MLVWQKLAKRTASVGLSASHTGQMLVVFYWTGHCHPTFGLCVLGLSPVFLSDYLHAANLISIQSCPSNSQSAVVGIVSGWYQVNYKNFTPVGFKEIHVTNFNDYLAAFIFVFYICLEFSLNIWKFKPKFHSKILTFEISLVWKVNRVLLVSIYIVMDPFVWTSTISLPLLLLNCQSYQLSALWFTIRHSSRTGRRSMGKGHNGRSSQ